MVVVGWLADDESDVWDDSDAAAGKDLVDYFDNTRECNRLLVVSGNWGGVRNFNPGFPDGFGSIVDVHTVNVCQRLVWTGLNWIDPPCPDFNGDGALDRCSIRLWDGTPDDPLFPHSTDHPADGGFFVNMQY